MARHFECSREIDTANGKGAWEHSTDDKEAQEGVELRTKARALRLIRGEILKGRKDSRVEGPTVTSCAISLHQHSLVRLSPVLSWMGDTTAL